ncbi:MAG: penicillin-insensitive murein endopeptidase [Aestuariivirga sp.]|uniref:penicillin-insensitive murein endopeptidase n=1 Tax=Aestuariivirga sp. TaxID=2650926 RepID=UPI0038D09E4D
MTAGVIRRALLVIALLAGPAGLVVAQEQSLKDTQALAAMSDKQLMKLPAKKVFSAQDTPTRSLRARSIGSYARGCMAGGVALPVDGPAWQVIRLSRNRYWGQPQLVELIEKLALESKQQDGWNGLLVGDISQPRGGPMPSGHASHQVGLDVDIWLRPMPDRKLSKQELENVKPTLVVKDRKRIDPDVWTEAHARLIKRAASYPDVARIFVHPPIKAELCKWAKGDRSWLAKVRPYYGHNYHFHIRMRCPAGDKACKNQPEPSPKDGTGCGEELAYWLGNAPWKRIEQPPPAKKPDKPVKPPPPLTLASLPAECRAVVTAE